MSSHLKRRYVFGARRRDDGSSITAAERTKPTTDFSCPASGSFHLDRYGRYNLALLYKVPTQTHHLGPQQLRHSFWRLIGFFAKLRFLQTRMRRWATCLVPEGSLLVPGQHQLNSLSIEP